MTQQQSAAGCTVSTYYILQHRHHFRRERHHFHSNVECRWNSRSKLRCLETFFCNGCMRQATRSLESAVQLWRQTLSDAVTSRLAKWDAPRHILLAFLTGFWSDSFSFSTFLSVRANSWRGRRFRLKYGRQDWNDSTLIFDHRHCHRNCRKWTSSREICFEIFCPTQTRRSPDSDRVRSLWIMITDVASGDVVTFGEWLEGWFCVQHCLLSNQGWTTTV